MTKYFDDFVVGEVIELGSVEITEDAIVEFAREFDPQPFHTDAVAARETPYGGLIASGWHTCSLYMRLLCDAVISDSSSQGSSGMDELRWLVPVRPGDTLTAHYTVLDARRSSTKPHRGTVTFRSEMLNQHDEVVLRMVGRGLYGTRDAPAG
ncbi:MaoC family dehydratase [Ilumatobacter sp.]|uniref:MaoC family dehydratase n=1 Tax=Ilumatobacter sp. TaxID=1967498 RepID=UPI003AF4B235